MSPYSSCKFHLSFLPCQTNSSSLYQNPNHCEKFLSSCTCRCSIHHREQLYFYRFSFSLFRDRLYKLSVTCSSFPRMTSLFVDACLCLSLNWYVTHHCFNRKELYPALNFGTKSNSLLEFWAKVSFHIEEKYEYFVMSYVISVNIFPWMPHFGF